MDALLFWTICITLSAITFTIVVCCAALIVFISKMVIDMFSK